MLEEIHAKVIHTFDSNVKLVNDLMDFDRVVVGFALTHLEQRQDYLKKANVLNQYSTLEPAIQQLKAIHEHDSLRPQYQAILNQGVVLLVSYFGSAVSDFLTATLTELISSKKSDTLLKKEIKLTVEDIVTPDANMAESLAELLIQKADLSFQDMKSIGRNVMELLNYEPLKDNHVNNIILAQACRNVIVHAGGIADGGLLNQLRNAFPRDLKQNINPKESVTFNRQEVDVVGESMKEYLDRVAAGVRKVWEMQ